MNPHARPRLFPASPDDFALTLRSACFAVRQ
jgi:hypothetical protein